MRTARQFYPAAIFVSDGENAKAADATTLPSKFEISPTTDYVRFPLSRHSRLRSAFDAKLAIGTAELRRCPNFKRIVQRVVSLVDK